MHYRYGEFHSERVFTDDGLFESRMVGPDGTAVKDERRAWFSPPPWASSPFLDAEVEAPIAPDSVVLGGRYRVREAIRHANKGGVYRAVDEHDGSEVIIKQARAHVGAMLDGTDARDWLREEARLLAVLEPLAVAPARRDLFAEQGDLFLVQEFLPGRTLGEWATEFAAGPAPSVEALAWVSRRLADVVRTVHQAELVIRDLKPANVMVSPFDEIQLIDVEFVAERGQRRRPVGTPGFLAPELRGPVTAATAEAASDLFSLGVTLFCAATALSPLWVSGRPGRHAVSRGTRAPAGPDRRPDPVLEPFIEPIVGLTETNPDLRWSLKQFDDFLATFDSPSGSTRRHARQDAPSTMVADLEALRADGLAQLREAMTPTGPTLWPRAPTAVTTMAQTCGRAPPAVWPS